MTAPLWQPGPDRIGTARLTAFMTFVAERHGVTLDGYDDIYRFSIDRIPDFWRAVWDFCGVIGDPGERVLVDGNRMPGARFFPDGRLNFAENLLRRRDESEAVVFWGEDKVRRRLSWRDLYNETARMARLLAAHGVGPGDRVAGYLPNLPETLIAMLATTSLGAVWSSCSPDFGINGVLDRFGQIEPKVLIGVDAYWYNGRVHDGLEKLAAVRGALSSVVHTLVVSYAGESAAGVGMERWDDALAPFPAPGPDETMDFARLPFDHPVYILYSSGTTGVPKCIVHGAGGTLLQHLKEHQLLADIRPDDRCFYFTTCGWMMWNWLASMLASNATVLLYDGAPFAPSDQILFDYAQAEAMTLFGTSAKYIDACAKRDLNPGATHDLGALRTVCSTGSPLSPEGFEWVYARVKDDVCLASISGGTDIVSCFVGGNPIGPVHAGEIQARGLGMAVEVWNEAGQPVAGEKGELVCVRPFPSMPVGFWNDPDGQKYRRAYFDRWPNVWCHGDFAELTPHGGVIIHGRSDATLNPGGVRIGTAEIYRQVEQLDEVMESLVIGQDWDGDVRVVLFVVLRDGLSLDDDLRERIRRRIRAGASPRHVPARIIQVPEIPRTRSGKIVELAVRDVVHGRPVRNQEALANPAALDHFARVPDLET